MRRLVLPVSPCGGDRVLRLDREVCRQEAVKLGWEAIANQFLHALVPIHCDKV